MRTRSGAGKVPYTTAAKHGHWTAVQKASSQIVRSSLPSSEATIRRYMNWNTDGVVKQKATKSNGNRKMETDKERGR
jgi:hypothetical protein